MNYLAVEPLQRRRADWDWMPLRRAARIRREANTDSSSPLLALSSDRGVEFRPEDGGRQIPSDQTITGYWRVRPGDLVFNPMWAIEGGVAVSTLSGAVSAAYRIYEPGPAVWPRFLHYWLRSEMAIDQYRLLVRGITTFDRSVTREDLDGMPIPVPPFASQRAIAGHLDRETAHIDGLIVAKRRMVELLEERWQGTVRDSTHARCVVSDARRLPDGWKLMSLRRCLKSAVYGIGDPSQSEGTFAVLGMANIGSGEVVGSPCGFVSVVDKDLLLAPGDLLFNRTNSRELVGKVGLVRSVDLPTTYASYLVRLRVNGCADAAYMSYLLNANEVLGMARSMALPSIGQANLNPSRYSAMVLPIPPVHEQRHIVSRLDVLASQTKGMRQIIECQINLLQRRRQALITAAVTGQLEIPEAA